MVSGFFADRCPTSRQLVEADVTVVSGEDDKPPARSFYAGRSICVHLRIALLFHEIPQTIRRLHR